MPTLCMLDLPFLKDFGLVLGFLHPHNRTSHFHLAFKTSLALLGGRFRSSVMACKQIQCISTFLLSVRATQMKKKFGTFRFCQIFCLWQDENHFKLGSNYETSHLFQDLIKDYFCWTMKKAVIFIHNLDQCLARPLLLFFSSFLYEISLWKYVSKFSVQE